MINALLGFQIKNRSGASAEVSHLHCGDADASTSHLNTAQVSQSAVGLHKID